MRNFIDSLKARRDAAKNEGGFSLIDVVVTVAIIVALSVGGFVTYTGIVDNAKSAATASAADQVYTAITVENIDSTVADNDPVATYNTSAKGEITVVEGTGANAGKVAAFHKASGLPAATTTYEQAVAADGDDATGKFVSVRG